MKDTVFMKYEKKYRLDIHVHCDSNDPQKL